MAKGLSRAAYGLQIAGLNGVKGLALLGAETWPTVRVTQRRDHSFSRPNWIGRDAAWLRFDCGQLSIDRLRRTAVFATAKALDPDELVHPYLAGIGAVFARWAGWDALHGGAVMVGDGAWGVLGDRHAGKSSMLAHLALNGHAVLADDLLVIARRVVLSGPRALDLRVDTAARLRAHGLSPARTSTRWRLLLPPVAAQSKLRGFVALRWAEEVQATAVPPAGRLRRLTPWLDADPEGLLELARLPMIELRRPREWDALEVAGARLLRALGDCGQPG